MNYTNIIAIYERLYRSSDQIKGESIDYIRGFQECVYILSMQLKKLPHINLHIENEQLKRRVYNLELRLDDNSEDRHVVFRRNGDLAKENKQLKRDIQQLTQKTRARAKTAVSFNPVEIEWEKEIITFFINTDSDTFMSHFEKATAYVNQQWARKKFRVYVGAIKCWYLEYYRSLGFICNPK